jgi:hypothetical protein
MARELQKSHCVFVFVLVLVAALYRALMQFMPSEHMLLFPFIRLAKAFDVMIGAGVKSANIAKTVTATADNMNFFTARFLSGICKALIL